MATLNSSEAKNDLLSIIIISYNTKQITFDCLHSLYKSLDGSKINFEVIVIDNDSKDGSIEAVKELSKTYTSLRLIETGENLGFARANNRAVKEAKGDYLLFLNSDIIVLDRAIEELMTYFREHEETIQFLGGKLLNKDMSPQPSCGPFFTIPVIFGFLFLKGDYWGLTRYSPDTPKEVDWVSGACILTTRKAYDAINGFDEKIFMYMDEIDMLYRAKQTHMRVFFYPKARFIHLGSASSGGKTYPVLQVFKGYIYFYKKHYGRLSMFFLRYMLQFKALIAILIGRVTNNKYLLTTYEQAYRIAKMD